LNFFDIIGTERKNNDEELAPRLFLSNPLVNLNPKRRNNAVTGVTSKFLLTEFSQALKGAL